MTASGVPYIGRFSARDPQWYVATGFPQMGHVECHGRGGAADGPDLRRQPSGCRGLLTPGDLLQQRAGPH